ncbi:putative U2 small nuclear ribonucleoprotein 40K [Trypanosoma theileri]|uniref:Putative U2 small nuclear ribonucleoprotein 40K n=1 Tax=Trypanosoma theileri TaxID=67003 RepID=A0A1X0P6L0_9TRYP|nr:putative U2 small nuclear ribonucleoprotein 40K [Trypanosoma theileri]ORC92566.1 putative U2 small nuclear ribonucleoprotein 40K [Trypanosoma theileri]
MRLTLDMIRRAPQFTNTLQQREIDLRGLGLTVLDEQTLLLLNDSFDVLNLSQNPLVRLEYFPSGSSSVISTGGSGTVEAMKKMMLRLQSLIVHRNRLSHVSETTCAAVLPNLRAFLADHNEFRELRDLLFLSHWRELEILSIEHNPVTVQEDGARLRAFLVYLCPKLKLINYQRVTQVDRGNVESMRSEFRKLVREWRNPGQQRHSETTNGITHGANGATTESAESGLVGEKKIRKRGREARMAAASNNTIKGDSSHITSGTHDAMSATAVTAASSQSATVHTTAHSDSICDDVDATQARLEALEAKMAAAETEEELLEVQQEIAELEAATRRQQERATKSKRTRTA